MGACVRLGVVGLSWALAGAAPPPSDVVRAALDAMGGVVAVRSITGVRIDGAGYANGDTAAGAGPAIMVFAFTETRDDRRPRLVQDVRMMARPGVSHRTVTTRAGGGAGMDAWLTEAPENVLLAAADAPDLASDTGRAVRFSWHGKTVRVEFAPQSSLPVVVVLRGRSGDVRTVYSRWRREPGGILYPHQWNVERHGAPEEAFTAGRVLIRRGNTSVAAH
jgi:hypothetical protein